MKKIFVYIQLILLSMYIYGAFFSSVFADVISPIHNLFAGLIILLSLKYMSKFKSNWILLAVMIISWGLTDLLWAYYAIFTDVDPNNMTLFMYLYLIPNLLLLSSAMVYFFINARRWNRLQLLLDVTVVTVIILGLGSALFFQNLGSVGLESADYISLMLYIITDILALVIILVMISSSRLTQLTQTIVVVIFAYLMYIFADLFYIDSYFNDVYVPNSISDVMFLMSFALFAIAAVIRSQKEIIYTDYSENEKPMNLGKSKVIWWVAILPTILFFLKRIEISYVAVFLFILMFYQLFSHYAQKSMLVELLYNKESELKDQLENLVKERTMALEEANRKLEKRAITDSLTGLFNRDYFKTSIENKLNDFGQSFSVLYLDLDRFKVINDLHGHPVGDQVLIEIANRFKSAMCLECIVARIGGDEFGILYHSHDSDELQDICGRIIALINEPIVLQQYKFHLGVSIGIARFPTDGETVDELMKYADIAMYHAKSLDTLEKHVLYSSHLVEHIERRNHIELLLRNAKYDEEMTLYYQPQFNTVTQKLVGMEALIRWHHPVEGFISPAEFIPITEEVGSIIKLSDWVFAKAMNQLKEWHVFDADLMMGMNVSPITLDCSDFFPKMRLLIEKIGVDPSKLDFEITEHSAMNSSTIMEEIFTALSGLNVNISIDDFGTGYSSLSYIKRFDVDTLKIAKELIDNIAKDHNDMLIVKAIIMMAKGMGLKTIAEGVETQEQLTLLEELECNFIQGYVLGRPVPADEFEKLYLLQTNAEDKRDDI